MLNERMVALGTQRSVIRELFEFGKIRAAEVGAENVFDFSIGNPNVKTPDFVNEKIIEIIKNTDSVALHGYTSATGDINTRNAIASYLNKTFNCNEQGKYIYLTLGAAASLSIAFNALLNEGDEVILFAPRGYNIAGKNNFSVAFNSLDVVSKKVRSVYFTAVTGDDAVAVSVECPANINNEDRAVQTVRVAVALSGTFTGANIECYYATQDSDRKRLIECYTKVNDNLGYLKYSLKTVSVTE